jgi:hypothetical protein
MKSQKLIAYEDSGCAVCKTKQDSYISYFKLVGSKVLSKKVCDSCHYMMKNSL